MRTAIQRSSLLPRLRGSWVYAYRLTVVNVRHSRGTALKVSTGSAARDNNANPM